MPLPPIDSEKYRTLRDLVRRKLRSSDDSLSARHAHWRRSERTYRLYADPTEIQEPSERVGENAELLHVYPTSIVIPLSYALMQTVVSFWVTLFTSDRPYFRFTPADPQSAGPARAQELLVTSQLDHIGYVPLLYQWFLDACRYGVSPAKIAWEVIHRQQAIRRFYDFPGPTGPLRIETKERQSVLEYEGNWPEIIDPFTWRPDPRWSASQFQRGSFCGEAVYRSYFELLRKQEEGLYENVEEIPTHTVEHFNENASDRDRIMDTNRSFGLSFDNPRDGLVLLEECTIDLIPDEVGLGQETQPQRWLMALANRSVLVRGEEFPYDHNDFPYAVIESSPDTHALFNPGLVEIMEPVHQHITWFVNSMIENARKSLNDRGIVDPAILNMDDLLSPSAGKYVRLNREYWGQPGATKSAYTPLEVQDISSANMKHVAFLIDMLQRISAASETLQGQLAGEERTATEVSSAAQQGASRLRTAAKMFSAMGLMPMARQMVQNNMQLLSQETYLHMVGSLEQDFQGIGRAVSGGGIMIAPEDIQGLFSFPVSDASSPLDPVRFARTWIQLLQMTLSSPLLTQRVDVVRSWIETVRAMGIPDPSRLLLPQQMQVMPDQQVQQQVQNGNLAPMQQPGGPPPPRPMMPMQQQPQSIRGEENRPQ